MNFNLKYQVRKRRFRWATLFLLVTVLLLAIGREFLIKEVPVKDALTRIRERGYLIALTDKNSLNYFINKGNPEGFQLELLEQFAAWLEVPLKIIVSNDVEKLYYYLDLNAGDVIALNLPVSREGRKMIRYADPLGETRLVLIQRKASGKECEKFIKDIKDFSADTVYMRKNIFTEPLFRAFINKTGKKIVISEETSKNTLELIRMVSESKIDYAVCDENLAMVAKRYFRNIDAGLVVSRFYQYAWAVNLSSDSLLLNINDWLGGIKERKELKRIYLSYYDNPRVNRYFQCEFCSFAGRRLSPYDKTIKSTSRNIGWDWRLIASLVYEESNFKEGQVSTHNASGLMQLMPETASKFGMDSSSSSARQIEAGVKYVHYLDRQLSGEITDRRERVYFTLASYNVGLGKVLRAREKAARYGLNPNKWNGNVDYYLTRKSKNKPNVDVDSIDDISLYGKSGGFVDNIMERYMHYRNIIPE